MRNHWRKHSTHPLRTGRRASLVLLVALALLTGLASGSTARDAAVPSPESTPYAAPYTEHRDLSAPHAVRATRAETLWIFDADFEDLVGDNAGWISEDRSGTLAIENYWHKDTIRINGYEWLGDSTWWCGTYNACWRQPRGYGNDWYQLLERDFPEVAAFTDPGDALVLEYDQRYAMESDYDYGYTDISTDGGDTWTTLCMIDNPGFAGQPGVSQSWTSVHPGGGGHMVLDISEYAGQLITLRFRFESDCAYSSQDQYNNPPFNSVKDGAWQLDNIKLTHNGSLLWLDDCESPGSAGWRHDDTPAAGQAGVTFWRGLFGTDIWTNRPFTCDEQSGWMYAAVDPLTSCMVDGEHATLVSPPINIEGVTSLVGQWDMWIDMPSESNDIFNLWLSSSDNEDCVQWPDGFVDEQPGWWHGGPYWVSDFDSWSPFAGNDWLAITWLALNGDAPEPGAEHMGGIFLNRQRVGVVSGDDRTHWSYRISGWFGYDWADGVFNDWFEEHLWEASLDSAFVEITDSDGVAWASVVASNDGGATWESYPMHREYYGARNWHGPPPENQMTPGSEILYYFEAADSLGNASTLPSVAPDECFEFSILPITGSETEPGILLVDKHNHLTPGEARDYGCTSEDFYREALDILGFSYDVYDVEFPDVGGMWSNGPGPSGMSNYDTQIWVTSGSRGQTLKPVDQANLIAWLSQASAGEERNLLVTGNDVGYDLMAAAGETLDFYTDWLATEFIDDSIGDVSVDSVPTVRDASGGSDFMTYDDRRCVLRGGCPELVYFDVIQPYPGVSGAELAVEYRRADMTTRPAGVAYTDTSGYQAVTLGFGIEFLSHAPLPTGHFLPGVSDRVDLMANIMDYFEKDPTGPGTGTEVGDVFVTRLEPARPNPFNPVTTIAFTLATSGRASVRVYDAAGRLVATLVDSGLDAGPHEVIWSGTNDAGERVASGIYFVRLEAGGPVGHETARKLVLLK